MEETTPASTNSITTRRVDDSLIIEIKRNDHLFTFTMPIVETCTWGMVLDASFDAFSAVQQLSARAIKEMAGRSETAPCDPSPCDTAPCAQETCDAELKE